MTDPLDPSKPKASSDMSRIAELRKLCLSHADLPEVQEVLGVTNTLVEMAALLSRCEEAEKVINQVHDEAWVHADTHERWRMVHELTRRYLEGE